MFISLNDTEQDNINSLQNFEKFTRIFLSVKHVRENKTLK